MQSFTDSRVHGRIITDGGPIALLGKERLRQIISDELVRYFDGSDSVAGVVITEGEVNHLVAAIFDRISHETGD